MHERDHLLRILCTGVGILRHSLQSLLFSDAIQYLARNVDDLFPLSFPDHLVLAAVQNAGTDTLTLTRNSLKWSESDRILLRYHCRLQLLRALDGDFVPGNASVVELGLGLFEAGLLGALPHIPRHKARYALTFEGETPQLWPTSAGRTFTTKTLLESFAVETELLYAIRFGRPKETATNLLDDELYRLTAALFDQQFRHRPTRRVPLEYDAILDAALWPPMTLRGAWITQRPWMWTDLEPGYRFCKLINWLAEQPIDRWHYAEDLDSYPACDAAVQNIQASACIALGWPTPHDLAQEFIEELEAIDHSQQHISPYAVLAERSPRLEWSIRLLTQYRKTPWSLFHEPYTLRDGGLGVWFPGGIFPDRDIAYTGLLFEEGDTHSHFWEYQVLTGARLLIEGAIRHKMPRNHALAGCRLIGEVGGNLLGDATFPAKMRTVGDRIRAFPPDTYPQER